MGTQRVLTLFVALAMTFGGIIYLRNKVDAPVAHRKSTIVRICTWSNYFPDEVLAQFKARTGITVEVNYMSSNEELLAKLKAGATGYDVIQPSDYMVRVMSKMGMLSELDHARLPHTADLEEFYQKMPYDPGMKVSVPFTWGTTGIALNTAKVAVPVDGVSWKMLLSSPDPKHTSLLDDMREVFGAVFKLKGLSINVKDLKTIGAAKVDINNTKNGILMFTSEPKPILLREEITVAHVYSVDAVQAHYENPKIQYYIPKEGGTIWTDNFAIPKGAHNVDAAHVFMDYFLTPENALPILLQNHLATTNKTAKAKLPAGETGDPNIYPPEDVLKKMEFLDDLGDALPVMSREWTEVKT